MISLLIVTQIYFVLLEALIGHRSRFNFNRGLDLAVAISLGWRRKIKFRLLICLLAECLSRGK